MQRCTIKILLSLLLMLSIFTVCAEPYREKGISVHFIPKRVADLNGEKWGLIVAYAEYLKPEKSQPVLQTTEEILIFIRKQEKSVQENGLWIVTTNPDAYSDTEKKLIVDLKSLCKKEKFPLFLARGSELPNGWHRQDL